MTTLLAVRTRTLLSTFAITCLALVFSPVHADSSKGMMKDGAGNKEHMNKDRGKDMDEDMPMMGELNLNDKQKEALRSAMKQRHESMQGWREFHEQLREMTQSDKYDEKQMHEMISKHNKETEDKIVKSATAMHEFYTSLSAEQKTKLAERQKMMKGKMKEHMKNRMKGDGGKECIGDDETPEGDGETD